MTYIVTWSLAATLELARIIGAHADPDAVDREAVWIDSLLRRYPHSMGESRSGSDRLWYADSLGVWYRVDDDAMTVKILTVAPARRH
ncbi:MAG: hypothetical protein K8U57_08130 [Planctomycetes bacterium]|nr:hypothetical protein [Planctomycetota bacterium]